MTTISVRPRTLGDREGLLKALASCARHSGYFAAEDGSLVSHAEASLFDDRYDAAWVAEVDGVVLGHIAVMPLPLAEDQESIPLWTAATGRSAEAHTLIKRLFVDPQAQGGGIARALMATAMAHLAAAGQIGVLDTVSVAQPAMKLYQGLGWREIGRTKPSWTDEPFDMVLFVAPGH
ncbi:GNAT family N-acetyltransferase [Psychromicrobium lacuslunae]|uniref:GNAT family N-acetyltransferase n=1 Tax=Psychromicrobium lacuslunae TaxID=1618207 RepID=UPI000698397E|nr:GNAT family N-acetyltransferase [Psychromicrobium lacuslunae]